MLAAAAQTEAALISEADHEGAIGGNRSLACQSCDSGIPKVVTIVGVSTNANAQQDWNVRALALNVEEQSSAVPNQVHAEPGQRKQRQNDPSARNTCPSRRGGLAFARKLRGTRIFTGFFLRQSPVSWQPRFDRNHSGNNRMISLPKDRQNHEIESGGLPLGT